MGGGMGTSVIVSTIKIKLTWNSEKLANEKYLVAGKAEDLYT